MAAFGFEASNDLGGDDSLSWLEPGVSPARTVPCGVRPKHLDIQSMLYAVSGIVRKLAFEGRTVMAAFGHPGTAGKGMLLLTLTLSSLQVRQRREGMRCSVW